MNWRYLTLAQVETLLQRARDRGDTRVIFYDIEGAIVEVTRIDKTTGEPLEEHIIATDGGVVS